MASVHFPIGQRVPLWLFLRREKEKNTHTSFVLDMNDDVTSYDSRSSGTNR